MVITSVVLVLFSSVAPWFHVEGKQTTYYCKDSFLWVFLIPPLTCLPLLLASTPRVRLCWWHCWTVTVISLGIYTLSSSIPTIFFSSLITFLLPLHSLTSCYSRPRCSCVCELRREPCLHRLRRSAVGCRSLLHYDLLHHMHPRWPSLHETRPHH